MAQVKQHGKVAPPALLDQNSCSSLTFYGATFPQQLFKKAPVAHTDAAALRSYQNAATK
jgi:hypothetical protein